MCQYVEVARPLLSSFHVAEPMPATVKAIGILRETRHLAKEEVYHSATYGFAGQGLTCVVIAQVIDVLGKQQVPLSRLRTQPSKRRQQSKGQTCGQHRAQEAFILIPRREFRVLGNRKYNLIIELSLQG